MGYFDIPKDLLIPINEVENYPKNEVIIIATGMQVKWLAKSIKL